MADVQARSLEKYQILLNTDSHALLADEPKGVGDGLGPDPYELLLSALGACTAMTLRMYARRKGWPLEEVRVDLTHERVHATDCASCEETEGNVERIRVSVHVEGDLDEEQVARIKDIATRCPVRKTLSQGVVIDEA